MDPKFKTSFIPRQEVMIASGRPPAGFRFSIFSIIAIVLFVASTVLSVAVFVYHKSLVNQINVMNDQLVAAKKSFEPAFLQELISIDHRLESAKEIINKHSVVTPIFNLLEEKTLQGVRFFSFKYSMDPSATPRIEMNGEASNFSAVALQSDVFGAESRIIGPVFSGLNLDEKGNAKFNFKASLDKAAFLYKNLFVQTKPSVDTTSDDTVQNDDNSSGI